MNSTNEKYAVVFDTNAYRYLVRDIPIEEIEARIQEIKDKEAVKNISPRATPAVALELLANLSGPGQSSHYEDCLKAIVAMGNHCYEKTENTINIIPIPYLHIAINFFDMIPPYVELLSKNMAGIIGDFKEDYAKAVEGHQLKESFSKFKYYVDEEESRWIKEVESFIEIVKKDVIRSNPDSQGKDLRDRMLKLIDSGDFVPRISMAIIFSMAKSLQIKMTAEEHVYKGYMLPRTFPLSVGFYQWICHRIVEANIDLQTAKSRGTRWNWRWDYEVSFLMNEHLINGRIVLLVTSDKAITEMLRDYGYGVRVMDLDTYLGFLDFSD